MLRMRFQDWLTRCLRSVKAEPRARRSQQRKSRSAAACERLEERALLVAPVLAAPGSIEYIEGSAPRTIAAGIVLTDVDATVNTALVVIPSYSPEDLLGFVNDGSTMGNIAISTNGVSYLTLTSTGGAASTAEWQSALRAVTYSNISGNPQTVDRLINFTVSDGVEVSNTLTSRVGILPTPSAATTTQISNTTPTTIVDGTTVTSTIVVSGAGTFLYDLNLTTFLQHLNSNDLDVTLTSPNGTVVTLTTDNGGTADDVFNGTVWDDQANPGGQVPYVTNSGLAGDHQYSNLVLASPLAPEGSLGALIGENPNGTWTLTITDDSVNTFEGSLDSWTLDLTTLATAPTVSAPTTFTNSTPIPIPVTAPPLVLTSTIAVSGLSHHLFDVDLQTFITHSFNGDLDITITSPSGTVVTLTTDNGGVNDNVFNGTVWNDNGAATATDNSYTNLTTAASLIPEEALAAFIGEDPNGTWTLTISDDANLDGGSLDSWSLMLSTTPDIAAPVVTNGFTTRGTATVPLAITAGVGSGAEATHFKITNIANGTLTTSTGTPISDGDFITAEEAAAGVKFTATELPGTGFTFSFDVQASDSATGDELSVVSTATVVVEELSGIWFVDGVPTRILQDGNTLTFINKNHGAGIGHVNNGSSIAYDVGPTAVVSSNTIEWSSGQVWTRAAVVTPDVPAGSWISTTGLGQRTNIVQVGNEFILTNRMGGVSRARLTSDTTFFATDWNQTGTFSENFTQLDFQDGAVWFRPELVPTRPDISGAWSINGQWTQIRQIGDQLTLVDANGNVSAGTFADDNVTINAPGFGITGTLDGSEINWSNSTTWTRDTFSSPVFSHVWSVNVPETLVHIAQVEGNGGELLLTNRRGQTSRGVLRSATEIYAVQWNMVGIVSAADTLITWSSGPAWTASPSDIDQIFGNFDPFSA